MFFCVGSNLALLYNMCKATIIMTSQQEGVDHIEDITTQGALIFDNDTVFVNFDNTLENNSGTKLSIGISKDLVTISRIGQESYTMVLQIGKTSQFSIKTQFGDIDTILTTHSINHTKTQEEINLNLSYSLQFQDSHSTKNTINLKCILHKE